jgi:hypothetical protein
MAKMTTKTCLSIAFALLLSSLLLPGARVQAQEGGGLQLGKFTPPPTPTAAPTPGGPDHGPNDNDNTTGGVPSPPSGPNFACLDSYAPNRGNNGQSRSRVYGMLLKLHRQGSLEQRFALADQDVITLAAMNYRLFGRLPSTDDRGAIAAMLGQQHESQLNYFYMKGFIRFLGIFGVSSFREVEETLAAMPCEARADFVQSTSSSPIRVFTDETTKMTVRVKNRIEGDSPRAVRNSWRFTARPDGRLVFAPGEAVEEIKFDYQPLTDWRPGFGAVAARENLTAAIEALDKRLGLEFLNDNIQKLILDRVPGAPYYLLSVFPKEEAEQALVWEVKPRPEREFKYIFYVKPLVEPVEVEGIPEKALVGLRFARRGLTVLDYNFIVDR